MTDKVFWNWDIVWSCNYRCSYCFFAKRWERSAEKNRFPSLGQIFAAWDRIYKLYGSCHVHIAGGEPFIYPRFMELLGHLGAHHTLEMSSNMSFDVDDFMRRIPPDKIKIDPSFHIEFSNKEKYIEKCVRLKSNGYAIGVTIVAYPKYLTRYVDIKKEFESNGIGVNLVPFRGKIEDKEYPDNYTEEEKRILKLASVGPARAVKMVQENVAGSVAGKAAPVGNTAAAPKEKKSANENDGRKNASERYYEWHVDKDHERIQKVRLCMMGHRYGKIHPDGDVFRCCTPDVEKLIYVGNIYDADFKLFDSPRPCSIEKCACWKSMIVGQEQKWGQYWKEK